MVEPATTDYLYTPVHQTEAILRAEALLKVLLLTETVQLLQEATLQVEVQTTLVM